MKLTIETMSPAAIRAEVDRALETGDFSPIADGCAADFFAKRNLLRVLAAIAPRLRGEPDTSDTTTEPPPVPEVMPEKEPVDEDPEEEEPTE